jgi:hypothetical protein
MDSFPSNSLSPKPEPREREQRKPDLKVVEAPIATGVRRKKPLSARFVELFFGGSIKDAINNVVDDVLVPAFKDMLTESVSRGMERVVFGDRQVRRPSRPSAFGGNSSYTPYNRYAQSTPKPEARPARRSRSSQDFEDVILPTRRDAENVLRELNKILDRYEIVTVRDLYELVNVEFHHTDNKWGWQDLSTAGIRHVANGYMLVMPETDPID